MTAERPTDAPARTEEPAPEVTGPAVVALGGGHGLSASLRAVRRYAGSVTAVVTVADDGGSSGRLREALPDLPAPGDVRKCLGALAEEGSPYAGILEHRFGEGELAGHALGNLLLVSLALEMGSFSAAIDEVAARVGAVGRVLPATTEAVALVGVGFAEDGEFAGEVHRVVGQVAVQNTSGLRSLQLRPEHPTSPAEVAASIEAADQVVMGPGSLFTSVLAAAIVPDVRAALHATRAQRIYVANLAPQVPETQGFSVADEVAVLGSHDIPVDVVLADDERTCSGCAGPTACLARPLADDRRRAHDPARLAVALAGLLGRTDPR